jgi:hypothetical protein
MEFLRKYKENKMRLIHFEKTRFSYLEPVSALEVPDSHQREKVEALQGHLGAL